MSSFISRIGSAADYLCMGFVDAGVAVKKGVIWVGEEGSRAMHEVYSLEGFEKASKAGIAWLRTPVIYGVFKTCLRTLEAQRDLVYATLVFGSTVDFIKTDFIKDAKTGKKRTVYSFQLPKDPNDPDGKKLDWVKLFYGIGNFFETAKFLQIYGVLSFPRCSHLANQVGSIKLFNLRGETWTFDDVPGLNCWTNKPKDFFVLLAAMHTGFKCLTAPKILTTENMLKLTASIGKIVLVTGAEYMLDKKLFWTLSAFDVVTNNASLILFFMKRHNERAKRLNDPTLGKA